MATDRDEQLRQQQELEEIRRSFAEMGARMGSLFEPAEADKDEGPPALPAPAPAAAPPPAPLPPAPVRPRWWAAAALVLVFVAGGVFGYILPRSQSNADPQPPSDTTASTRVQAAAPPPATPRTRTSVPESCLETAQKGDEVIARLIANIRDNRLSVALKDYTVANQACRKEASP